MKFHDSEVTFALFFSFFARPQIPKGLLETYTKMPSLILSLFFFFLLIPLPPAVQDGVVVITDVIQ